MKKAIYPLLVLALILGASLPLAATVGAEPGNDLVFGITSDGEIHEVNPNDGTYTVVGMIEKCINTHSSGPNGLAYDPLTNRIYYTEYPDQRATGHPYDNEADLYFIDLDSGDETYAGKLPGEIADADIYDGKYYYIAGGGRAGFTDDLYEVALDATTGMVTSITEYADISGDDAHAYGFWGDIAISADGLIYGIGDCKVSGHNGFDLFTVNLDGSGFDIHSQVSEALQVAFGCDGTLYGHKFGTGDFYEIDIENWEIGSNILSNSPHYTDMASKPCPNVTETPYIDIKPASCPNPLNVDSGGVLPVAILGTEDFDVNEVDPATVELEGVPPLRWALEDVAAPYTGEPSCDDEYACTTDGPDGFMDLTLKFHKKSVIAAIGDVSDGDVTCLTLTGKLKEEFGGTEFTASDVIRIKKKDNGSADSTAKGGKK